MGKYWTLSNFGSHYFLEDYTDDDTIPAQATLANELRGLLSCSLGKFSKDIKKYRTLDGDGWESAVTLGNSAEDGSFECVRLGTGNAYKGVSGSDTYTKVKDWFMKATAGAGVESPKCVIEVKPRKGADGDEYEGTCYFVLPKDWGPGDVDTENGQEYSFTVTPFGPPIPLVVTHTTGETESWAFTKAVSA